MRILLLHTSYLQKGGEDAVFKAEAELLKTFVAVKTFELQNSPGWRGAGQFALSIWNVFSAYKLKRLIATWQPDIIHLHNFHFAMGPLVVRVAKKAKVPVVLTVHNYRLLCPSATLSYNGELFTQSLTTSFPWAAIRRKVYRDSMAQTFWLAFVLWFHKSIGTWRQIDRYIVLTDFARSVFVSSSLGVDERKFVTKPNSRSPARWTSSRREHHFLYIGRLSAEKGIRVLLEAFSVSGAELLVAGEGPMEKEVIEACKKHRNIQFAGRLDREGVERQMQSCTALIFPSIWYEGLPMTMIEALSTGTPVITSRLGSMEDVIRDGYNGLHFKAGDANDLAAKVEVWRQLEDSGRESYRRNALKTYEARYTPELNRKLLLDIYRSTIHLPIS